MSDILVIPDKFKGSISGAEVSEIITRTLRDCLPDLHVTARHIADGGEGTAQMICGGNRHEISIATPDGVMSPVGYYADGDTAAIDTSELCGKAVARIPDPFDRSSYLLGSAITALVARYSRIIIGLGGTLTVDGGAGMLQALGAYFYDRTGALIHGMMTPALLPEVSRIDLSGIRIPCSLAVVSDVRGTLCDSDSGTLSSLDFAAQKGVHTADIPRLRATLQHLSHLIGPEISGEYDAAAGGLGYAICAVLGTQAVDISRYIGDLSSYDLVITGEGRFDRQTAAGKGPWQVIEKARRQHVKVLVVCGQSELDTDIPVIQLTEYADSVSKCIANAPEILATAIRKNIRLIDSLLKNNR